MNILNSRRKRERRKIEGTVLHEQVDELKGLNEKLAAHNRHLEELLEQANAEVAVADTHLTLPTSSPVYISVVASPFKSTR